MQIATALYFLQVVITLLVPLQYGLITEHDVEGRGILGLLDQEETIFRLNVALGSTTGPGLEDYVFEIDNNGAAKFAGGNTEIASSGSISVNRLDDNTRGVFVGKFQGTDTAVIRANGSAEFAQIGDKCKIELTRVGSAGNERGYTRLDSNGGLTASNSSGIEFFINGSQTAVINYDGNTTFNLEPDNPANYTTTMIDGEEQQVYSGPTLDVKERLQNLISRIDAIEANEIIDDATDNSLLLAIAELTSRLDARDATIADLQARITTLGKLIKQRTISYISVFNTVVCPIRAHTAVYSCANFINLKVRTFRTISTIRIHIILVPPVPTNAPRVVFAGVFFTFFHNAVVRLTDAIQVITKRLMVVPACYLYPASPSKLNAIAWIDIA